jgi:hypothetical protein
VGFGDGLVGGSVSGLGLGDQGCQRCDTWTKQAILLKFGERCEPSIVEQCRGLDMLEIDP